MRLSLRLLTRNGFSLPETLLVIVLIAIFSLISFNGLFREDRRTNALAAANDIAGWLEAVRRNSERGAGCIVNFNSSSFTSANKSTELASSATDSPSSIPNQCRPSIRLFLTSVGDNKNFSISIDPVTSFIFTPRGTLFNPSATDGSLANPIHISINVSNGGTVFPPMYCVVIRPPMGEIDIISSAESTSGRCP